MTLQHLRQRRERKLASSPSLACACSRPASSPPGRLVQLRRSVRLSRSRLALLRHCEGILRFCFEEEYLKAAVHLLSSISVYIGQVWCQLQVWGYLQLSSSGTFACPAQILSKCFRIEMKDAIIKKK